MKLKTFEEFEQVNEGHFEPVEKVWMVPFKVKRRAKDFLKQIKASWDKEWEKIIEDLALEYGSYSEGPDPRPASDKFYAKLKKFFPEEKSEIFHIYFVKDDWMTGSGFTYNWSIAHYLYGELVSEYEKKNGLKSKY